MIWFTGDTHSNISRFNDNICPVNAGDTVIICGDFGCVWNYSGESFEEMCKLDWLASKPYTICFIDGNHENFDRLNAYPVEEWCGGCVHKIRPNVIHLMRGYIFTIEGKTIFTMGGAKSHDIQDGIIDGSDPNWKRLAEAARKENKTFRVSGVSWWKEELPSPADYATADYNLENAHFSVDYIITHEAPTSIVEKLYSGQINHYELMDYLNMLYKVCDFKHWYCGHHHINLQQDKITILYESIINE